MSVSKLDIPLTLLDENLCYAELVRSIPERERDSVLKELEDDLIIRRSEELKDELDKLMLIGLNLTESRILFLAALRGVKMKQISAAQLATLHLLDSAIRTLYIKPTIYFIHEFVDEQGLVKLKYNLFSLKTSEGCPRVVRKVIYDIITIPNDNIGVSELPKRMQQPLIQRFFNFTSSEWIVFCNQIKKASKSEQYYYILNAPKEGCWSSIIFLIQKILKCMRVLDWIRNSKDGFHKENIMLVPSFTMFQTAITAKAHTLNRNPVQFIPTYGYIEAEHYAELKASGKIAMALYLPETKPHMRYRSHIGGFKTIIDGHPSETAFCGAIHDVYHAMREMSMSENVAKARMRLASIAKTHPKNKIYPYSRAVDDILVDGELIYSYPPEIDTMFENEYRPLHAEEFGMIFYVDTLKNFLHPDLKRAFIEDMVINKSIWQDQFGLGRNDLVLEDRLIYDELLANYLAYRGAFCVAQAIRKIGLFSATRTSISTPVYQPSALNQKL